MRMFAVTGFISLFATCNLDTLVSPNCHLPCQDAPVQEVWSWRTEVILTVLTGGLTFRAPNCKVGTTFAKRLIL